MKKVPIFRVFFRMQSGESWEDDIPVPTYDPVKAASGKDVLRAAKCVPKKALAEFRANEKIRR